MPVLRKAYFPRKWPGDRSIFWGVCGMYHGAPIYRISCRPSAFQYQRERNRWVCREGKILHRQRQRKVGHGMIYHIYEARFEDCQTCRRKPKCYPNNTNHGRSVARLEESPLLIAFRKKMSSEEAQQRYHSCVPAFEPFGTSGSGSPARRFSTSPARKSANGRISSPTLAFSSEAI
jgi:Transposase DDE domain